MKVRFIYIILILGAVSCLNAEQNHEKVKLISFKSIYLRPSPIEEYLDSVRAKPIIKKEGNGDTLDIRIDIPFSGCARFDGDLSLKRDSIILLYWAINDTSCMTLQHFELKYRILKLSEEDLKIGLKELYK